MFYWLISFGECNLSIIVLSPWYSIFSQYNRGGGGPNRGVPPPGGNRGGRTFRHGGPKGGGGYRNGRGPQSGYDTQGGYSNSKGYQSGYQGRGGGMCLVLRYMYMCIKGIQCEGVEVLYCACM